MQNFVAKLIAVATLVGGFSFTGDLGWIAEKGQRIIGAVDVPEGFDRLVAGAPPDQPAPKEQTEPAAPPHVDTEAAAGAPPREQATPPEDSQQHSPGSLEPAGAPFKPPVRGVAEVPWASLGTGSRVIVWLAGPPYRCLVLDFVDAASGEALLYEVATVDQAGKPLATVGPPKRVIVGRNEAGIPHGAGLVRGGSVLVTSTGIAPHTVGQWVGPIVTLVRP